MNGSLWNWLCDRFRWCPTSEKALEDAEYDILSYVKHPVTLSFVSIDLRGEKHQIRTLCINEESEEAKKRVPLVLLHGLGGGIGLWVMNLDALAESRTVYAIDVLGFGLSSRPPFPGDALDVEDIYVESIEQWCQQMKLKRFILLGHSMGGFISSSYAIKYPERIIHLVLADPWGFSERSKAVVPVQTTFWGRILALLREYFNPYAVLRVAGPIGPTIVRRMRPDIMEKFAPAVSNLEVVSSYIYHCNAQTPSGEVAFKVLSKPFGWAVCPMINRFDVHKDIPITFIYGAKSFIDSRTGYKVKQVRSKSHVEVVVIPDADHFLYACKPTEFNAIVNEICEDTDKKLNHESGEMARL